MEALARRGPGSQGPWLAEAPANGVPMHKGDGATSATEEPERRKSQSGGVARAEEHPRTLGPLEGRLLPQPSRFANRCRWT